MKIVQIGKLYFIIGLLGLSQSLYASDVKCYTQSQTMKDQGDAYYDLDAVYEMNTDEQRAVSKLIDDMKGDYEGSYSEYYCTGSENNLKQFVDDADLKLTIESTSKGGIKLALEKKYLETRVTKTDKITMLDPTYTFDLSIDGSDLRIIEKYRRGYVSKVNKPREDKGPIPELYDQVVGNKPDPDCNPGLELYSKKAKPSCKEYGSRFAEMRYTVSQLNGNSYKITIETYYNGYLSHVQWLDVKQK